MQGKGEKKGKFPWYTGNGCGLSCKPWSYPGSVQDGFESQAGADTVSGPMHVNDTQSSCTPLMLLFHLLFAFHKLPTCMLNVRQQKVLFSFVNDYPSF